MDIYEAANKMKYEQKNIFDLKLRVTFYARVSTTKEEQENSIENQITFFTDFIKNSKNWTYTLTRPSESTVKRTLLPIRKSP